MEIAKQIWGYQEISNHRQHRLAQNTAAHVGYRTLSGKFQALPEERAILWPLAARNALVRTVSIYEMERAAEYDKTIENMLCIAGQFNSNFFFQEFQGTVHVPALARYWRSRALEEIQRRNFSNEDTIYLQQYASQLPIDDPDVAQMINSFAERLKVTPTVVSLCNFLRYLNEQKGDIKYDEWSDYLSNYIRQGTTPNIVVLSDQSSVAHIKAGLSDLSTSVIMLNFDVTEANVGDVIEGLQERAKRKDPLGKGELTFLEFSSISPKEFSNILRSLDDGVEHEGKSAWVNLGNTIIKTPFERDTLQKFIGKRYPKLAFTVLD